MQTKLRLFIPCILFGLLVFWSIQATGQEWSEAQKEVWKTVQASWEIYKNADVEATIAMKHEDSAIWWSGDVLPFFKKGGDVRLKFSGWWNYDKMVSYKIQPISIQVVNNVAIVYYLYDWKGTKLSSKARCFETWIKEDNKWLHLGSLSASCDKTPTCVFAEDGKPLSVDELKALIKGGTRVGEFSGSTYYLTFQEDGNYCLRLNSKDGDCWEVGPWWFEGNTVCRKSVESGEYCWNVTKFGDNKYQGEITRVKDSIRKLGGKSEFWME